MSNINITTYLRKTSWHFIFWSSENEVVQLQNTRAVWSQLYQVVIHWWSLLYHFTMLNLIGVWKQLVITAAYFVLSILLMFYYVIYLQLCLIYRRCFEYDCRGVSVMGEVRTVCWWDMLLDLHTLGDMKVSPNSPLLKYKTIYTYGCKVSGGYVTAC